MIYPKRNFFKRKFFSWYIDRLLKKHFDHFYTVNEEPEWDQFREHALLVLPNHFSWYDGFFIDYLNRYKINKKEHVMISEHILKKYNFFRALGGYSMNFFSKKHIDDSLFYTSQIMSNAGNMALMFPQGKIEPYGSSVHLKTDGIDFCVQHSKRSFYLLPVFFKIAYFHEPKPDLWAYFAKPVLSDEYNARAFETMFIHSLGELNRKVYERKKVQRYF